jgi:beta-N-acetylhexosaminidase
MTRVGLGIALAALCLLGGGWAVLGSSQAEPKQAPVPRVPADLTPRQLAGQRIVCGFAGRTAPSGLVGAIRAGEVGGVILFSRNIASRPQLQQLVSTLQSTERPASLSSPLIVSVDQEGGQVKRLPGPPKLSAEQMGGRGPRIAQSQGAATARSLRAVGINVDLAPVLDVARPQGFIAEQDRGFGSKPGRVKAAGVAFARGLQGGGVAATAKHFPGLGSTAANTDLRPARIRLPAPVLRRVDEAPYRGFAAAGGKLVMISSARYPALGTGPLPASQSRAVATDELRGRLGFQGVSISDSLEAPGATAGAGIAKVALRAAKAGTDLLLYVHCDAAAKAAAVLANALAAGTLDRAQFEASVDRVLALRATLPTR